MNNIKVHYFQSQLLAKLGASSSLRFNELSLEGLESEHMNYHLKKLLNLKLVQKSKDNTYSLTDSGKDYFNLLDEDTKLFEKQPKTGVLLDVQRTNDKGEIEHLLTRRLVQPYLHKVGRLTGKARLGETIKETAERELMEETGLTAGKIKLQYIYRKIRRREDGETVQDVIFYSMSIRDLSGTLISKTPFQENFWITADSADNDPNVDVFDDLNIKNCEKHRDFEYTESVGIAEGF
jgi:ADP-ribose pyrophosphatase YjhB (NUDIX family)